MPRKPGVVQFDWRRHWRTKVEPFLGEERVQAALDEGMRLYDPTWTRGDPPCEVGAVSTRRVVRGKLSWYQPVGRCHGIALFSLAIGLINYPRLTWKMVSSSRHAVPVGCGPDGEPRVVMDILLFESFTAEESLEFADPGLTDEQYFARLRERLAAGSTGPRDVPNARRRSGHRR